MLAKRHVPAGNTVGGAAAAVGVQQADQDQAHQRIEKMQLEQLVDAVQVVVLVQVAKVGPLMMNHGVASGAPCAASSGLAPSPQSKDCAELPYQSGCAGVDWADVSILGPLARLCAGLLSSSPRPVVRTSC